MSKKKPVSPFSKLTGNKNLNVEIATNQEGCPSDVIVITPKLHSDGTLDRSESWIDKETLAWMSDTTRKIEAKQAKIATLKAEIEAIKEKEKHDKYVRDRLS